ncbi:MAG: AI-2E family transporter [Verrucomicrobiota bacterium]
MKEEFSSKGAKLSFTELQAKTIAAGLTTLATAAILCFLVVVFWLVAKFVAFFSNVILPLAVAAALALLLKPFYDWLCAKLRIPKFLALTAVFVSCLLPLTLFLFIFGFVLVGQMTELIPKIPLWYEQILAVVYNHLPSVQNIWKEYQLDQKLTEALQQNGEAFFNGFQAVVSKMIQAGVGVSHWATGFLGWLIMPVYLAFFLMTPKFEIRKMEHGLPFLKKETRDDVIYLCKEFVDIMVAFFRGQFLVALAQGILFAIGFSIVGLQYGFVIGFALGLLNLIPYLGNMVGLAIALPTAFFQQDGGVLTLGLVIGVFVIVQVLDGLLITPRIMGEKTGLHPLAIIVAIFFWGTALNGLAGMLLAIPLTAFFVVFWRLAKQKYIRELL